MTLIGIGIIQIPVKGPIDLDPGGGGGGGIPTVYYYYVQGYVYKENDEKFAGATVKITGPGSVVKYATTTSTGFFAKTFTYSTSGSKTFTLQIDLTGYRDKTKTISLYDGVQSVFATFRAWPDLNRAIANHPELAESLNDVDTSLLLARYWELNLGNYDPLYYNIANMYHDDHYMRLGLYELYNISSFKYKARFYLRMDLWQDPNIEPGLYTDWGFDANVLYNDDDDYWYPIWDTTTRADRLLEQNESLDGNLHTINGTILHRWIIDGWWIAHSSTQEFGSEVTIGVEAGIIDYGFSYNRIYGLYPSSILLVGGRIKITINNRNYGDPPIADTSSTTYYFFTRYFIGTYCSYIKPVGSWLVAAGTQY